MSGKLLTEPSTALAEFDTKGFHIHLLEEESSSVILLIWSSRLEQDFVTTSQYIDLTIFVCIPLLRSFNFCTVSVDKHNLKNLKDL